MLEILRRKLWETIYLNPVYPHELLENTKDPDYLSVNFKPAINGVNVFITFIDEGQSVDAVYYFDEKDYLQSAVIIESGREATIYNRKEEIASLMTQILSIDKTFTLNQISA
jgi:hypothetical protein